MFKSSPILALDTSHPGYPIWSVDDVAGRCQLFPL
jgi:hypothetical protein